jgi:hypothetical protein
MFLGTTKTLAIFGYRCQTKSNPRQDKNNHASLVKEKKKFQFKFQAQQQIESFPLSLKLIFVYFEL